MECVRQSILFELIDRHVGLTLELVVDATTNRRPVHRRRKVPNHLSTDSIPTDRRERRSNGLTLLMVKDEVVGSFASTVLDEWTVFKGMPFCSDLSRSAVNRLDAKAVDEIFSVAVE